VLKQKIALFAVAVLSTTMLVVVAGEIYLRRTQSYIVAQKENLFRLGIVEQNPGLLIRCSRRTDAWRAQDSDAR
jgi:hypothetical protein